MSVFHYTRHDDRLALTDCSLHRISYFMLSFSSLSLARNYYYYYYSAKRTVGLAAHIKKSTYPPSASSIPPHKTITHAHLSLSLSHSHSLSLAPFPSRHRRSPRRQHLLLQLRPVRHLFPSPIAGGEGPICLLSAGSSRFPADLQRGHPHPAFQLLRALVFQLPVELGLRTSEHFLISWFLCFLVVVVCDEKQRFRLSQDLLLLRLLEKVRN
ncbi:hypothetical protein BHM03_00011607 [Ensete ventricosum]|nr:hypothetical protein BHM03_00011607 [Ensete ventricosum]